MTTIGTLIERAELNVAKSDAEIEKKLTVLCKENSGMYGSECDIEFQADGHILLDRTRPETFRRYTLRQAVAAVREWCAAEARDGGEISALIEIETRIREHIRGASMRLLGVGQCLNEAKDGGLVPHGEWEDWVQRNTGFSVRQAQRVMKAAREVPEGSIMQRLEFSKVQALLQLPVEEREEMAKRVEDEDMPLRALQKAVEDANAEANRQRVLVEGMQTRAQEAEAKNGNLREAVRQLNEQLSRQKAGEEARIAAAVEQLKPTGISDEARAEIDRLKDELAEANDMAERQSELRKQTQDELTSLKMAKARGENREDDSMTAESMGIAVRTFLGTMGLMPHMSATFSGMRERDRQQMIGYVAMLREWCEGTDAALMTISIDGLAM